MRVLSFRFEPLVVGDDSRRKFMSVVYDWGKSGRSEKLGQIFGLHDGMSPLTISQNSLVFEVGFPDADERLPPCTISSEDLAVALDLDPSVWTIWRRL